jgi:tetratricopeptide (TPR) repeat protein
MKFSRGSGDCCVLSSSSDPDRGIDLTQYISVVIIMQRRDYLQSLASFVSIFPLSAEAASERTDFAAPLRSLAETFDETDIKDPFRINQLRRESEQAVSESKRSRSTWKVDLKRHTEGFKHWAADVFSFLPGQEAPSKKPQIERDIAAIELAERYYEAQISMLQNAESLSNELAINERELFQSENQDIITDFGQPLREFSTAPFRIETVEQYEILPSLLPDQEQVTAEAEALKESYRAFIQAQTQYRQAVEKVEQGALLREQRDFSAASDAFDEATSVSIDISPESSKYAVGRVTLAEYQEILGLYADGAAQMLKSCRTEMVQSNRGNELFSAGLDNLFTAYNRIES